MSLFVSFVLFILSLSSRLERDMVGNYSATVTVHMYRDTSMKGESKAVIWVITVAGSSHQDTVFTQSHPSDKPHNYNLFPEKVKFEALLSSRMSDRQIHAMTQAVLPPISDCIIGLQLMKSSDLFSFENWINHSQQRVQDWTCHGLTINCTYNWRRITSF